MLKNMTIKHYLFLSFFLSLPFSKVQAIEWGHGLELRYSTPDIEVNDMPLEIRDVPIHPDDAYVTPSNAGPIEKRKYDTKGTLIIAWRIKKQIADNGLKVGLGLQWILYPTPALYDNELRNYTNAVGTERRGIGAALTFVGLEKRGTIPDFSDETWDDLLFNITPELFVEIPFHSKSWIYGASIGYFKLQAVNGWDRHDSLEEKDHFTLAHVIPFTVSIKHKFMRIGISYPYIVEKTNLGEEADIKGNINVLFSLIW